MKQFLFIAISFISIHFGNSQSLKLTKSVKNDSLYLSLINPFKVPIEISISALDSTKSFIKVNPYGILNKKDTLENALVIPSWKVKDTSTVDFNDYVKFNAKFGNPNEDYDNNYEYELPFQKGKRYKIIQSFGGNFSHNKPHSKYAIDFGLSIGDTITAARSGTVYFVKEDSKEYCPTRKCVDLANKIYIVHDDGTMAHYVHLDYDGALVNVGDMVKVNQPIAISGMTGFTTTPHLHFVLYKARSISIPFKFKGIREKKLKQGKYLQK
jgi:murein DD-endopeptidase MepM/ murein hydrolase activator NlpD